MIDAFGVSRETIAKVEVYHGTMLPYAKLIARRGFKAVSTGGKRDPRGKQVYITTVKEDAEGWARQRGSNRHMGAWNGYRPQKGRRMQRAVVTADYDGPLIRDPGSGSESAHIISDPKALKFKRIDRTTGTTERRQERNMNRVFGQRMSGPKKHQRGWPISKAGFTARPGFGAEAMKVGRHGRYILKRTPKAGPLGFHPEPRFKVDSKGQISPAFTRVHQKDFPGSYGLQAVVEEAPKNPGPFNARLSKSFLGGGLWKPVTALTRGEREMIRGSAGVARQGGKGLHRGASGVTYADRTRAERLTRSIQGRRKLAGASDWFRGQMGLGSVHERPLGAGTVKASYAKGPRAISDDIAGNWGPTGGTGPQRRNKGFIKINEVAEETPGYRKAVMAHEMTHADVRKPMSAFARHDANRVKLLGDEARADHAKPLNYRKTSLYRQAAMDKNPFKRHSARKQIGTYAGETRAEQKQAYAKYRMVTRKLEGIDAQRGMA